jgi:nucleoside-diphosphate-sugar epimerase
MLKATHNLLEYSRKSKIQHFIYASSGGVYAESKNPLKECSPTMGHEKLGCYLGSKLCGEILVQNYSSFFTTSIVRPFFIYGLWSKKKYVNSQGYLITLAKGKSIDLSGDEGLKINPIHVEDAVQCVESLLEKTHSSIYNLAGPVIVSLREICEAIGDYLAVKPFFNHLDRSSANIVSDISLMKSELHTPVISLNERIGDLR